MYPQKTPPISASGRANKTKQKSHTQRHHRTTNAASSPCLNTTIKVFAPQKAAQKQHQRKRYILGKQQPRPEHGGPGKKSVLKEHAQNAKEAASFFPSSPHSRRTSQQTDPQPAPRNRLRGFHLSARLCTPDWIPSPPSSQFHSLSVRHLFFFAAVRFQPLPPPSSRRLPVWSNNRYRQSTGLVTCSLSRPPPSHRAGSLACTAPTLLGRSISFAIVQLAAPSFSLNVHPWAPSRTAGPACAGVVKIRRIALIAVRCFPRARGASAWSAAYT